MNLCQVSRAVLEATVKADRQTMKRLQSETRRQLDFAQNRNVALHSQCETLTNEIERLETEARHLEKELNVNNIVRELYIISICD